MNNITAPSFRLLCSILLLGILRAFATSHSNNDIQPISRTEPIPSTYFGMHFGGMIDYPWPDVEFTEIRLWDSWGYSREANAYVGVSWRGIHIAPDTYRWELFDKFMDILQTRNLVGFYTFGYSPSWVATGNDEGTKPPDDLSHWEAFVSAIVTRAAGRIKYWGVWNEPNAAIFYSGTPARLAEMASRAYTIIKAIDSTAMVTTPEVQGNGAGWLAEYFAAGGSAYCDIIAFHLYGYPDTRPATESGAINALKNYKSVRANAGLADKPLWNTEYSSHIWGDSNDADYIGKTYAMHWALGIDRNYWYMWDNEWGYGTMWRPESGVNPAARAFTEVRRWLIGAIMTDTLHVSNAVFSVNLVRPNSDSGKIVWHQNGTSDYPVPAGKYKYFLSLDGDSTDIASTAGFIPLSNTPKMLIAPTGATAIRRGQDFTSSVVSMAEITKVGSSLRLHANEPLRVTLFDLQGKILVREHSISQNSNKFYYTARSGAVILRITTSGTLSKNKDAQSNRVLMIE